MDCNEEELELLIHYTGEMINKTRYGESKLNDMLSRANRAAERIQAMYRYGKILDDMRDLTVNGSRRKLILDDLQRENRQLMQLQDENRQLRESTEACLNSMAEIVGSHTDIQDQIENIQDTQSFDDVERILKEVTNKSWEKKLKISASKMQKVFRDLEAVKRDEELKTFLAIQRNKTYREMFKPACLSNPNAINVLNSAMKAIIDEMEGNKQQNSDQETEDDEFDDDDNFCADDTIMNKTIERRG